MNVVIMAVGVWLPTGPLTRGRADAYLGALPA